MRVYSNTPDSMDPVLKKRVWKAMRLGFKELQLVGSPFEFERDKNPIGTRFFKAYARGRRDYVTLDWDCKQEKAVLWYRYHPYEFSPTDNSAPIKFQLKFEDYEQLAEVVAKILCDRA